MKRMGNYVGFPRDGSITLKDLFDGMLTDPRGVLKPWMIFALFYENQDFIINDRAIDIVIKNKLKLAKLPQGCLNFVLSRALTIAEELRSLKKLDTPECEALYRKAPIAFLRYKILMGSPAEVEYPKKFIDTYGPHFKEMYAYYQSVSYIMRGEYGKAFSTILNAARMNHLRNQIIELFYISGFIGRYKLSQIDDLLTAEFDKNIEERRIFNIFDDAAFQAVTEKYRKIENALVAERRRRKLIMISESVSRITKDELRRKVMTDDVDGLLESLVEQGEISCKYSGDVVEFTPKVNYKDMEVRIEEILEDIHMHN